MQITETAQRGLVEARQFAQRKNHNYIGTEHLLAGMLHVSCYLGIDLEEYKRFVPSRTWIPDNSAPPMTPRVKIAFANVEKIAKKRGQGLATAYNIIEALLQSDSEFAQSPINSIFMEMKFDKDRILQELYKQTPMQFVPKSFAMRVTSPCCEADPAPPVNLSMIPGKTVERVDIITTTAESATYYLLPDNQIGNGGSGGGQKVVTKITFTDKTFIEI